MRDRMQESVALATSIAFDRRFPDATRGSTRREWMKQTAAASVPFAIGTTTSGALLGALGCATDEAPVDEIPPKHPLEGLQGITGSAIELPPLVGEVTLLDFWASWCVPCKEAFRYLDQLYRTYLGDGLRMLAISVDDELRDGRRFAARMRPKFPLAWDTHGKVRGRFLVETLPTTVLLDANARVVHRHSGFDLANHRVLEAHVRRLVRGA